MLAESSNPKSRVHPGFHDAVENLVLHTDYLATLLHLFGLNAEELTYTRNNQQLTILDNQPARVVKEILA